jgi:hypothetical protein
VDTTTGETAAPGVLRELEVLGERTKVPGTLVLHLTVGHEEGTVDSEDGTMDDGVLEMETGEVVTDTDTVGDGEVPVVPVTGSVVENDTLSEVVRSVTDELDAVAERFGVGNGFLVPVHRRVSDEIEKKGIERNMYM